LETESELTVGIEVPNVRVAPFRLEAEMI